MPIQRVITEPGCVPAKVWTHDIEESAEKQIRNMLQLPFIHKHIAVMPDVHWGMGSTVGSVIPTIRAIVPAAVGVDLGCGMMAQKLDLFANELPDNLGPLRSALEAAIPHGRTNNGGPGDRGAWGEPGPIILEAARILASDSRITEVRAAHPKMFSRHTAPEKQLGTLGTGNHFVELCIDKDSRVWLMLHSGSRGVGNRIGTYFIDLAKEQMEQWHIALPDPDLAYLPAASPLFDSYWKALSWAQKYARVNRELMMEAALCVVQDFSEAYGNGLRPAALDTAINCHHNYVEIENHYGKNVYVTRKGAVRARKGDLGIIPGSMGAESFIVRGLGNPESFDSCSHGAGRRMSRAAAKKQFSVEDLALQTTGVECRKDADIVDEIPGAYKDIQQVMDNQSDLVEIVAELKQVLCVKG